MNIKTATLIRDRLDKALTSGNIVELTLAALDAKDALTRDIDSFDGLQERISKMSDHGDQKSMSFQEYCEQETEKLKSKKVIFRYESMYLSEELAKRWPTATYRSMVALALKDIGIYNIEDFFDFYSNPKNKLASIPKLSELDSIKLESLYLTCCEEGGELADVKFRSYIANFTGGNKASTSRILNALRRAAGIDTKARLMWAIKNDIDISKFKGISLDVARKLEKSVKEELL